MPQPMPQPVLNGQATRHRHIRSAKPRDNSRLRQLIPLLVVFYSFLFLPPEVEFSVFGISLPSYRIALLAMSVPAAWMMLNRKSSAISISGISIMIASFWILLSFMTIYGPGDGLVRGAGIIIDTAFPYFVARACVKSFDDLRYFLILCLPGLVFAAGAMLLESLMGRLIVRPAFAAVLGNLDAYVGGDAAGSLVLKNEYRLGLLRAYGPFPHPILAGVIMVGFLPLYMFSGLRSWPLLLGIGASLAGFFALSSAAFLALVIVFATLGIHHIKRFIPKVSWWQISGLAVLMVWTLQVISQSGVVSVIARLTLAPETAEYRKLIWEYGSASVVKHPWFGIGYNQWERLHWMGESVDAHFLLLAVRHGLIVPVILLFMIIYNMIKLGKVIPQLAPQDRAFAVGINIMMVVYLLVGQTVNYFGSANIVFMSMVAFLTATAAFSNEQASAAKRLHMVRHPTSLSLTNR